MKAMKAMYGNNLQRIILFCVLLALAIFALGLTTPQNVAESILYVVVVLASLRSAERRVVFAALILCTLLTVTGFFLSLVVPESWISLVNRTFAITAFWTVGLIGLKHLQAEAEIRKLNIELEHSLELTSRELLEANAELSSINTDLEMRVAARTAELSSSEARFRGLFEHAPVSIWEEDFSDVRQYINDLRGAGVVDFPAYFDAHPDDVAECAARVKIVDVNRATLKMYQAESKEQLLANLSQVLGPKSLTPFKEELLALVRGDMIFETKIINYTLHGERRVALLRLTIAPGYEQTWAKVFVGISDITEHRQAEDALRRAEENYRNIFESSLNGIFRSTPEGRFVMVNPALARIWGYDSPEDLLASVTDTSRQVYVDPDRRARHTRLLKEQGGNIIGFEYQAYRKDGSTVWVSESVHSVVDSDGALLYYEGAVEDISEHKQAEEALRQSEERFKLIAWATTDVVWDWDLQTNQIWWGPGLQKIFHYALKTDQTDIDWWRDHVHPQDKYKVDHSINQALEAGLEFWSKEYRFQRADGTYADIMDRAYIIRDEAGKASRMIGAMLDITERKQMESSLLQSNEKMGRFLNELQERNREASLLNEMSRLLQSCQSTQEAYGIIADLASQLFPRTAGALYLLNAARTQVSPIATWGELSSARPVFAPDDCLALRRGTTQLLHEDQAGPRCAHLSEPPPAATYCLLMQMQGKIIGVFHLQSASEENLAEPKRQLAHTVVEQYGMALSNLKLREALLEQSIRDPLTGLYNRRYMEEALKQQLSRVARQLHPLSMIMIDIDHFKLFNDTQSHAAGDALLRELGQFLQNHVRGEDVACRYGGEEFILIMPDASLEAAQQRAEHLRQEVKELRVQDAGQSLDGVTLSLGVAIYPEHGRSMEAVMRAADAALYRAKQEGRDRVVVAERAY